MLTKLKPKSEFNRNVFTLITGTTIAQAVPIAISPILTRIYTPEDFGVFALYMAIAAIISVIATGRYEMAIMLPKKDEDVRSIVKLILILLSSVVIFVFLIVFIFNQEITELFENKEISNWLYFLPLSIFLVGVYQVVNYLLIREKSFKRLAKNKVIVSTSNASIQLAIGLSSASSFGLLFGNLMGYIVSIFFIIRSKIINKYFHLRELPIKKVANEYKNFPKYDLPSVLINLLANQLPFFALGKYFSLGILGYYSLMYKVLMMPINLLSNTVLDVFKQKATEDYNKYGNCKSIYISTLKKLFLLGIIPFTILGIFAPDLFAFVFGNNWRVAGEFAQIMTPMLFMKFVVGPLSYTFYISNNQFYNLAGQLILFCLIFVSIYYGIQSDDEYLMIIFFSISNCIAYLFYLGLSYKFSKGDSNGFIYEK
ncbi:MAG: oligosaccharide flippase family protein [Campylobacterota bacterium]|nr:oligosaccharide flippase family protein [Campylobacterota bacterium]